MKLSISVLRRYSLALEESLLLCGELVDTCCVWLSQRQVFLIGFRNISDVDGPEVADTFYEYLKTASDMNDCFQPDTSRAARALQLALAMLRCEKQVSFLR